MQKQSSIGIAVIGSGRIGTLRARLAAKHPAVRFLERDVREVHAGIPVIFIPPQPHAEPARLPALLAAAGRQKEELVFGAET